MDEITIVKRETRLLPILLTLLVVAILVLAGLWLLGMLPGVPPVTIDVRQVVEAGSRYLS